MHILTHLKRLVPALLLCLLIFPALANKFIIPTPPKAAVGVSYNVVDFHSKKPLAQQDVHQKREIASLTKLMTAYVTFKRIQLGFANLEDSVSVSNKAYKTHGSRSFIEQGKDVPLKVLLKGMIIQSGNDASIAIAEHIAGDEETFVKFMNHYSKELGMKNTLFSNASGLSKKPHYSTAYDLSLLSIALIQEFPDYYLWFSQKEFTHNNITQKNRNNMLWTDSSIDGLKTGFTNAAGYCLIVSSMRNGMRVVSVVLGTDSKKTRTVLTKKLLEYSFRFYETQLLMDKSEPIAKAKLYFSSKDKIDVGSLNSVYLTMPRGKFSRIKQTIKLPQDITAPISLNQELGYLEISEDGEILEQFPLYTLEDAPKSGFIGQILDKINRLF